MASPTEGKSNLSFILNKPHDLSFEERPIPTLPTEHDVLVAVNYTGICGSDVHYWQHGAIGHFVVKEPMVLGHESAGTVVSVGSAVTTLKVGDRVALEPGYPCRRCPACLGGKYNLCSGMRFAATPPYDGTLTGFWAAPADFCFRLPDSVSLQEGALIEPLAVGVHIVKQARVTPGASVVVMGAGPVGLLCAAVARAFGATTVVSVDIVPSKLEVARQVAATHTYLSQRVPAEENARLLIEAAGLGANGGADVVIDASGAEPSIQTSLHAVRVGGTYVQGGMGRPDITFPIMALCIKEVTARGSFRYGSGDYKLAIELVAAGKVNLKALISETVGFRQAEEAFSKVKEGQVIKVLIAGPNEEESKVAAIPDATDATAATATTAKVESAAEKKEEEATTTTAAPAAEEAKPQEEEQAKPKGETEVVIQSSDVAKAAETETRTDEAKPEEVAEEVAEEVEASAPEPKAEETKTEEAKTEDKPKEPAPEVAATTVM